MARDTISASEGTGTEALELNQGTIAPGPLTPLCARHIYRSGILWPLMIPNPDIIWKVELNSGARASLTALGKRKQIWRPQTMSREEFFRLLPEGKFAENETVEKLMKL